MQGTTTRSGTASSDCESFVGGGGFEEPVRVMEMAKLDAEMA